VQQSNQNVASVVQMRQSVSPHIRLHPYPNYKYTTPHIQIIRQLLPHYRHSSKLWCHDSYFRHQLWSTLP